MSSFISLFLGCAAAILVVVSPVSRLAVAVGNDLPPLNDPPTEERLVGKVIWTDLFSPDPKAAAKFYEGLFGWTATPLAHEGRSIILLRHEGRPVAGIVQRPLPEANEPGVAHWVSYFAVADLERALARVKEVGGRVLAPARDFSRRGTQAIVEDSQGAVLGLLQSASGDPEDYQAEPGEWIWVELFAAKTEIAATFYRSVFGYEAIAVPNREKGQRFTLAAFGFARAGITEIPPGRDAQPAWLTFVRVESTAAAVARAIKLGGRVVVAPQPSPFGTPFAILSDPTGAEVAVVEFKASTIVPSP